MLKKLQKYHAEGYVLFRVIAGLMFALHGGQKLFGWFGGPGLQGFSEFTGFPIWLAALVALVEFVGGLGITVGFFSRLSALGSAVVMVGALVLVHFSQGWNPLLNKGELALLYLVIFLNVLIHGNGKWSLEQKLLKKEVF